MSEDRISRRSGEGALLAAPAFVLVEPQMGENIGAVARAMLNFGLSDLRLVRPRDGWPNPAAVAMASGAARVIDGARIFERTEDALADCAYVLATTARRREMLLPVLSPDEAAGEMKTRIDRGEKCAVLFGGERAGLSNDDVARSYGVISIPVNPAFASLNLAQAALLIAYEWAQADGRETYRSELDDVASATHKDLDGLITHLFSELESASYFFPPEKRPSMERNLRVALTRAGFTESEVRSLRGVIKALARASARGEK